MTSDIEERLLAKYGDTDARPSEEDCYWMAQPKSNALRFLYFYGNRAPKE